MFYDLNIKVIIELNDLDFYEKKLSFKLRNNEDINEGTKSECSKEMMRTSNKM